MATILLIGHEESEWVTLAVALEAAGHHVMSAADGREGLRLIHDHVVDLVLVDLVMSDMDGLDCGSAHTPFHASRVSC
ncbi:MAG: response regulator [Pyrinomonadaceae bacterium]|nr:response regulator [Pyrinomonadaceae bacterium]